MTPEDIIAEALIPGTRSVLVLGSYEKRVTVYSQQVRALNLVDAMLSQKVVRPNGKIAIVGGGAAGLTAGVALAKASTELSQLDLFEAQPQLLYLQHNSQRYLHPHFYDWPAPEATQTDAGLPIMNWTAGAAGDVADVLRAEFQATARTSHLKVHTEQRVLKLEPTQLGSVRVLTEEGKRADRVYDAVILAIGFGLERYIDGDTPSYWTPSGLAGSLITPIPNPLIFISGNGDGGLVDFQMAAFNGLYHAQICELLAGFNLGPALDELKKIEEEAWGDGSDVDLLEAYRNRVAPLVPHWIWAEVNDRLRPNVRILLHTKETRLLRRTVALHNRFATFMAIEADQEMGAKAITVKTGIEFDGTPQSTGDVRLAGEPPFSAYRKYLRLGPDGDANLLPFLNVLKDYPGAKKRPPSELRPESPKLTPSARARFEALRQAKPVALGPSELDRSIAAKKAKQEHTFQQLVALKWTIDMLVDDGIEWIEIDSTYSDPSVGILPIRDLVIKYSDGRTVCCRYKSGDLPSSPWPVERLMGDLEAASSLLSNVRRSEVKFYSPISFGELQALSETAIRSATAEAFDLAIDDGLRPTNQLLSRLWHADSKTSASRAYEYLKRISFESPPANEEFEQQITDIATCHLTRPRDAIKALWYELSHRGAHLPSPDGGVQANVLRLTRHQALVQVQQAGAELGRAKEGSKALQELRTASAVGRNWRRDINGRRLPRAAVSELLRAIDAKQRGLLLTDGPGAGKTCILLDVVETLETRTDIATLFIQAREFAEAKNDSDRVAQGFPNDLLNTVSSLSSTHHVVVVIDSLDVLAQARESAPLSYFLSLVDRLATIPNTTTLVACRAFDLKYDRRLSSRSWDLTVEAGALDWTTHVAPLLEALSADLDAIEARTRVLLGNARHLALFADLIVSAGVRNVSTGQELAESYLEEVVLRQANLGEAGMAVLESMATQMVADRTADLPRERVTGSDEVLGLLQSEQVIVETHASKRLAFGHQTLLDVLAVRGAIRSGQTLPDFIRSLPPVPFVRPTVRAFVVHLRSGDPGQFRRQMRAAFDSSIAYHLKRLLAESFAASDPVDGDWHLVSHLERSHPHLFWTIFDQVKGRDWYELFRTNWLPRVLQRQEVDNLEKYANKISQWSETSEREIVEFWNGALTFEWIEPRRLSFRLGLELQNFASYPEPGTSELLGRLIDIAGPADHFLSPTLMRFVEKTGRGHDLIWRFITAHVDAEAFHADQVALDRIGSTFLRQFFIDSIPSLDVAITSLQQWNRGSVEHDGDIWRDGFLKSTSWDQKHSQMSFRHQSDLDKLVCAIEEAVLDNAKRDSAWWRANARDLALNADGGLRYMAMSAITANPEANKQVAAAVLTDPRTFSKAHLFELGQMIEACLIYLDPDVQETVSTQVLNLHAHLHTQYPRWVDTERLSLLASIPAPCRTAEAEERFGALSAVLPAPSMTPSILRESGSVRSPYSSDDLRVLSNEALLELLRASVGLSEFHSTPSGLTGGVYHVERDVVNLATADSRRFLHLLRDHWASIPENFRKSMLEGATVQLRARFGNVQYSPSPTFSDNLEGDWLARAVIEELQRHDYFWSRTDKGAEAILACSEAVAEEELEPLLFLAAGYVYDASPKCWDNGEGVRLNSNRGRVAEAVGNLLAKFFKAGESIPELLHFALRAFATDCHPQIRAAVLLGLPQRLFDGDEVAWSLFQLVLDHAPVDWSEAEPCLYATYHRDFQRIAPYLENARTAEDAKAHAAWARISALAVLSGHQTLDSFLEQLIATDSEKAWSGAMQVWVANLLPIEHRGTCLRGLQAALDQEIANSAWMQATSAIFAAKNADPPLPLDILRAVATRGTTSPGTHLPYGLDDWLATNAQTNVDLALEMAEMVTVAVKNGAQFHFDPESLGTMLTAFFREAEDREQSDHGATLKRVVALQDAVLAMPNTSIDAWLKAAERPENVQ